jgi:hypothetical protein
MRFCSGEARVTALISIVGALLLTAGTSWAGPAEIEGEDTIGCYDQGIDGSPPSNSVFYVSTSNRAGRVTANFVAFGDPATTQIAAAGPWGGPDSVGPGVYTVQGTDGVWAGRGVYNGGTPTVYAALDIEPTYVSGGADPIPLVGLFASTTQVGVAHYYPATGIFHFQDNPGGANGTAAFEFGPKDPGNVYPVVGDWDGDGVDTVGVYDSANGIFYLTNGNSNATVNTSVIAFAFGAPGTGLIPVAGDWDNSGDGDTIGAFEPSTNTFRLRDANDAGTADYKPILGDSSTCQPIVGDWNFPAT